MKPSDAPDDSILLSVKKALGLEPDYDVFDQDILLHINSVFFTLNQLGVGPETTHYVEGFMEPWIGFTGGDNNLNAVKSYMYIRVRLLFDPPGTSFGQEALKKQAEELEWRLNVYADKTGAVTSTSTEVEITSDGDGTYSIGVK